jgi:alkanesulfonate monooxygenase SsuD/methylene tetrahydromethanopterin reductase-like flavin-dependent oxidoreductase (luciferase family)
VRVTPRPVQRPRPPIFMGAASAAAARRAARHADGLIPQLPELFQIFREERVRLGKPDPGPLPPTTGNFVWLAEDPDAAWERLAPYAMHEMNAYGRWMAEAGTAGPYRPIEDAEALRATGSYPVWTPSQLIERVRSLGPGCAILLHPLVGGADPELSWESLELFEKKVLPAIQG